MYRELKAAANAETWAINMTWLSFAIDEARTAEPRRAAKYGNWRYLMLVFIVAQLAGIVYGNGLITHVWGVR